jgi:hypothetical protein
MSVKGGLLEGGGVVNQQEGRGEKERVLGDEQDE